METRRHRKCCMIWFSEMKKGLCNPFVARWRVLEQLTVLYGRRSLLLSETSCDIVIRRYGETCSPNTKKRSWRYSEEDEARYCAVASRNSARMQAPSRIKITITTCMYVVESLESREDPFTSQNCEFWLTLRASSLYWLHPNAGSTRKGTPCATPNAPRFYTLWKFLFVCNNVQEFSKRRLLTAGNCQVAFAIPALYMCKAVQH